jgi:hypothetical protein
MPNKKEDYPAKQPIKSIVRMLMVIRQMDRVHIKLHKANISVLKMSNKNLLGMDHTLDYYRFW